MAAMINVEFQNCFIFMLLCLFSLLCYSLLFRKPSSRQNSYDCDLPPSPPSMPIIGHLHLILSSLVHKSFQKISSKYGPLLHLRIFNVPIVLVSSASVAYDIFRVHDKFFLAATLRRLLEKLGISLFQKEIMGVSRGFDELLERILREHEEKPDEHHDTDMMDALLAAYNDEKAEYKITRNQIKAFIVDMFIAGTDISALTTQGTMAEIINNPNVLVRIREKIDSVVGKSRLIQETDLPKLPYSQAVVKEGLRLHPPTPLMVREFQEGCKVKGFYIPASTTLVVNGYAVMRDPNVWEEPEEFKPERFLASSRLREEEEIREQALKYIAFGSGRRGCPGTNIAYIFVGTAIGMMVQCFDWKIKGDKVDMKEAIGGLNLTLAHPLKCTPVARSPKPF
ncbi:unnamed protein product [Arabidopsis thaliana]|uniref:Uncharacterized protein n=1 Tax=Arabidopsis thaliana TaxID=3702 RepID=Q9LJZ1_ARATH|nr:unnamed protein product [Arabidopsis thaliana]